jgi:hypothetical protein
MFIYLFIYDVADGTRGNVCLCIHMKIPRNQRRVLVFRPALTEFMREFIDARAYARRGPKGWFALEDLGIRDCACTER